MKFWTAERAVLAAAASLLASPAASWAQAGSGAEAAPMTIVTSVRPELTADSVVREIDDPSSGTRWLLVEDPAHPGGPGRLVAVYSEKHGDGAGKPKANSAGVRAVIRAGDAVQVEEHSAVVDASLQAVALGAAAPGGRLRVRLHVGGRVVEAVALAPGRAALAPETGARP